MNYIALYAADIVRYRRLRMPTSGLGWLFMIIAVAAIFIGTNDDIIARITDSEPVRKILKVLLGIVALMCIIFGVAADMANEANE